MNISRFLQISISLIIVIIIYGCPREEPTVVLPGNTNNVSANVSNNVCIDTLLTQRVDPKNPKVCIPDTIFQKYFCDQVVVTGITPTNFESANAQLENVGLDPIKGCICDSVLLYGWPRNSSIKPEERRKVSSTQVDQNGDGFFNSKNYVINIPQVSSIPDTRVYEPMTNDKTLKKVRIAIIDSGIDFNHSQLAGRGFTWSNVAEKNGQISKDDYDSSIQRNCINDDSVGYDFVNEIVSISDENGHGSHIAGIITRREAETKFNVELLNLKIFGKDGGGLFELQCALQYAILEEADIVNLSLGYYTRNVTKPLEHMLNKAEKAGILVVTSAGNDGYNNDSIAFKPKIDTFYHFPSDFVDMQNNILSVAALDTTLNQLWINSNFGKTKVNIAAPGQNILSTYNVSSGPNSMATLSGTSMATGYISRIAAIIMSNDTRLLGYSDIKKCILDNATRHPIKAQGKMIISTHGKIAVPVKECQ